MNLPFTHEEYYHRQSSFLDQLPDGSVVVIPTNTKKRRSNDTSFPFRANSYMLYLSGWNRPGGIWVADNLDSKWKTSLYVRPNDTKSEIWEGRILGPDFVSENMPVDDGYSINSFEQNLIQYFQHENFRTIYSIPGVDEVIDELINDNNVINLDAMEYLDKLRVNKSEDEIKIMKNSAELATQAHILAMKSGIPGVKECHLQSIIEGHFVSNHSHWAYPSIVGGGDNATILHYSNNQDHILDGELVLIDAGCEIYGYASDITRTWPVNGKFTDPQREIYELVLRAEKSAIQACQVGAPWRSFHEAASKVLAQGMIDLGILECSLEEALGDDFDGPYRNYFMHGTGHLLGLDVHDVGGGRQGDEGPSPVFSSGMILTVEPGLYFSSWRTDVPIPSRYSGIGVRIEDNILITDNGPIVLTSSCPKEIDEIEAIIGTGEGFE
ncbi:MAG: aminopeptidase P N-terminal domain-containing protein [Candidatus Thermoplasmatota archaeon]|nr:aminopeptidase P N-terminal domain-containing protein [Candidatus Thermoplasmatota archaeon]